MPGAVVCRQIDRFSSSVQSRLVRRAIKHHSVHYRWWTLTGTITIRQSGQAGRLLRTPAPVIPGSRATCNPSANARQAFGRQAKIAGYQVLRDATGDLGAGLDEKAVPFLGLQHQQTTGTTL